MNFPTTITPAQSRSFVRHLTELAHSLAWRVQHGVPLTPDERAALDAMAAAIEGAKGLPVNTPPAPAPYRCRMRVMGR